MRASHPCHVVVPEKSTTNGPNLDISIIFDIYIYINQYLGQSPYISTLYILIYIYRDRAIWCNSQPGFAGDMFNIRLDQAIRRINFKTADTDVRWVSWQTWKTWSRTCERGCPSTPIRWRRPPSFGKSMGISRVSWLEMIHTSRMLHIYVSLLEGMSLGKPTRWRGEHLLSTTKIGIEPGKKTCDMRVKQLVLGSLMLTFEYFWYFLPIWWDLGAVSKYGVPGKSLQKIAKWGI